MKDGKKVKRRLDGAGGEEVGDREKERKGGAGDNVNAGGRREGGTEKKQKGVDELGARS